MHFINNIKFKWSSFFPVSLRMNCLGEYQRPSTALYNQLMPICSMNVLIVCKRGRCHLTCQDQRYLFRSAIRQVQYIVGVCKCSSWKWYIERWKKATVMVLFLCSTFLVGKMERQAPVMRMTWKNASSRSPCHHPRNRPYSSSLSHVSIIRKLPPSWPSSCTIPLVKHSLSHSW